MKNKFLKEYEKVKNECICVILYMSINGQANEVITSMDVDSKVKYIDNVYDDNLNLKSNINIKIYDFRFVTCENKMTFGEAISYLKNGFRLARAGWNGKGIFIEIQNPDSHSKMTHPYIYIDTTGLKTNNPDAPKNRVPWLASQTDLLAEDWYIVME